MIFNVVLIVLPTICAVNSAPTSGNDETAPCLLGEMMLILSKIVNSCTHTDFSNTSSSTVSCKIENAFREVNDLKETNSNDKGSKGKLSTESEKSSKPSPGNENSQGSVSNSVIHHITKREKKRRGNMSDMTISEEMSESLADVSDFSSPLSSYSDEEEDEEEDEDNDDFSSGEDLGNEEPSALSEQSSSKPSVVVSSVSSPSPSSKLPESQGDLPSNESAVIVSESSSSSLTDTQSIKSVEIVSKSNEPSEENSSTSSLNTVLSSSSSSSSSSPTKENLGQSGTSEVILDKKVEEADSETVINSFDIKSSESQPSEISNKKEPLMHFRIPMSRVNDEDGSVDNTYFLDFTITKS